MVDVPRKDHARKKRTKKIIYGLLIVLFLVIVTWGVYRLEPAAPSIDRSSVWLGKVERGSMVIEVRGPGTLVPEEERWVAASTAGRVEKIIVLPGSKVTKNTVLMVLGNPELERDALDAELQLEAGVAELEDLQVELQRRTLEQQALAASVKADFLQKSLEADLNEELAREGLISDLTLKLSRLSAEEAEKRHQLEKERLRINERSVKARIDAKEAEISRIRGLYQLRKKQVDMLKVKAGIGGVLQQTPVEVGQLIPVGGILGKVAVPGRLRAELRIPETQAKDVIVGLSASIDTRNGVIPGEVIRVDPAATQGTVTVDVALKGDLPLGARPDLNVDGTVQISYLEDVVKMGRPVFGQPNSTIGIFKLVQDTNEAIRTSIRLGSTSVTTVQVLEGLREGDEVILSDTSAFDGYDKIRIE